MPERESQGHSGDRALQEWICRQNIESFRRQLATAGDDVQRAQLAALLAEEEANLARLTSAPQA